jgi:ribosome-binding factor A
MTTSARMVRVNENVKRALADIVEQLGLSIEGCLLSITKVDTSPNLRTAKVHVSVLGGGEFEKEKSLKLFKKHRGLLQKNLSTQVTMKYTPHLEFVLDRNMEEGARVLALMDDLDDDE